MMCYFSVPFIFLSSVYFTKYYILYKIKAIYLTRLCSKFEVDITKIEVVMRFCLGVIPKMTSIPLILIVCILL